MGKDGLEIPLQVLEGPLLYDTVLEPGNVLYMPRGYVHEACTLAKEECSFHVTLAIPTQDWTLAGAVTQQTQAALASIVENRMAIPLSLLSPDSHSSNNRNSTNAHVELLQQQLDAALTRIRQQVTVDSIVNNVRQRIQHHNERALQQRTAIIQKQRLQQQAIHNYTFERPTIIGRKAAARVTLDTVVRASTPEEKALVVVVVQKHKEPRGLNVREDTANALLGVLQKLKATPGLSCQVSNLLSLLDNDNDTVDTNKICDLTLLSFVRCCVELGGMTIVR